MPDRQSLIEELLDQIDNMLISIEENEQDETEFSIVRQIVEELQHELYSLREE